MRVPRYPSRSHSSVNVKVLADQRLQLCQVLLCECALQSEMLSLLNAKADEHRYGGQALRGTAWTA